MIDIKSEGGSIGMIYSFFCPRKIAFKHIVESLSTSIITSVEVSPKEAIVIFSISAKAFASAN